MRFLYIVSASLLMSLGILAQARADIQCEERMTKSGLMHSKADAPSICRDNPTPASQSCITNLLQRGKGRMRVDDMSTIVGLCKTDPRSEVQACFAAALPAAPNAPNYKGMRPVASRCLRTPRAAQTQQR